MRLAKSGISAASLLAASLLVSGCSTSFESGVSGANEGNNISGVLYGGQQPIVGASIYVYAASTTGFGGVGIAASTANASKSLLTAAGTTNFPTTQDANGNYYVTTDAQGGFTIAAGVTCTTGTQVYLYSIGGVPGGYSANTAAGLMATLGNCGDGLVEDTIGTNTRVVMNEASTIATAFATAGYATDATHIGALSTSDTLAATGIKNAFASASLLYSLPYGSTTARATTPNGNGAVPQTTLNSLANILAGCVNSTGPGSGGCNSSAGLFYYATSTGVAGGTAPTDTATAAINIAHFPGSNVAKLFLLASNTTIPFYPALTKAPNDFSISIVYTGGGLVANGSAAGFTLSPHSVAVDAAGNVWTTNPTATVVSEFSPLGVPASATGFSNSLNTPFSIAIDTGGNVWVPNEGNNSLSKFTSAGAAATGSPFTSTALKLKGPTDVELDSSGNLWVPNFTSGATNKIAVSGSTLTLTKSTTSAYVASPISVALLPGTTGRVYEAELGENQEGEGFLAIFSAADAFYNAYLYLDYVTIGSAVDSTGYVWAPEQYSEIFHVDTTGDGNDITTVGASATNTPQFMSVAVDGASNAWITDVDNGTIDEVSVSNTVLSPTYGYLAVGNTKASQVNLPLAIAVDGSGNVWYTTANDATLREIVGIAVPVATPIAYATASGKLGAKP